MRRLLVVLIGLTVAIAGGLVFLAVVGLAIPETRDLASHLTLGTALTMLGTVADGGDPARITSTFVVALWSLTGAMLVLPAVVAGLVGEIARTRSYVWYAAACGLLTAALPWIGHASGIMPDRAETKLLTLLFVTGAFTGSVYWLLAGRSAGPDVPAT